ncbi:glycosyltransferase family 4 protein [Mucilaginibacter sp.]|uniref:glycosyltransferase family 4 protein n=1 Tax=Mucilaginibacter sp. TaxID=1882438 RepID=UPI0035BC3FF9
MKVVIINNDFKAYWRSRLIFLNQYLGDRNIDFRAVELFGKGSPYAFDIANNTLPWWQCIFPDHGPLELDKYQIKEGVDRILNQLQPDVVIGSSIVFYPGALGVAWAKRNRKKFIMFDDAKPSQFKRNIVVQGIKNLITAQADSLWLPSKTYDREWAFFKQKGVNFFYGFNTIDNDFFGNAATENKSGGTIICVARLVPVKNIDSLLKAWQKVQQHNSGYRLMIVGNGPQEEKLKQLSHNLGLITVDFVDAVNNYQLPAYLSRCDAFILPSLSETWGLVVNEAMAAGLPVLLSRTINAADDLLQTGINGYGFNPQDVDEISQVIIQFIDTDRQRKASMGKASLEIIAKFTFDKMGEQLANHLNWLAVQPPKIPGPIAVAAMKLWYGRYNTGVWDHVDKSNAKNL